MRPQIPCTRDSKPDWDSNCSVFDRGTPYIGNGDVKRPNSTTLKIAMAWTMDVNDESLRDCPLISVLIEAKGPKEIASAKRRVAKACLDLFGRIAKRAEKLCAAHQIYIASVLLSLPASWSIEAELYYEKLIRHPETFDLDEKVEVFFLREVEADAHYLFHDDHACRTVVSARLAEHRPCKFLIADFGGFSFVSTAQLLKPQLFTLE